MKDKNKTLKLSMISWAFVFLFNPNLNIVDILPDFIGYAILCVALSRLADLNEDIATAHKGFGRALLADFAKLVSVFLVFGTQNPEEQNTMLLLVSFIFATVELIILIPAYNALFGGMINLGYKFDNTSVLSTPRARSKRNRTEKIRSFTFFFLIVKSAMCTLPEFAVLSTHSYDELSSTLYIYDFVGLLRSFAIILGLIVGIVWLCCIRAYFKRVRKDEAFISSLLYDYETNVLVRKSLFIRKAMRLTTVFLTVAAVLCLDFRVESFNVFIDTFAAIALIALVFTVKKHISNVKKCLIPFFTYAFVSLAAQIVEYGFFSEYYYGAILRNDEAYGAYCVMLVFAVLDAVAFLFAVWGMSSLLGCFIKEHTGFSVPGASLNVEDKIKKVHAELYKKIYLLYGAALLAAASDLFYDFGARTMRFAGFVNTVCGLVFLCAVVSACYAVSDEVESKYMLE